MEASGNAELSRATCHASTDHQAIARLVDEQWTGDAGKCGGADKDGDLLVAAQRAETLNHLESMTRRPSGVLGGRYALQGPLDELRHGLLAAGQVLHSNNTKPSHVLNWALFETRESLDCFVIIFKK